MWSVHTCGQTLPGSWLYMHLKNYWPLWNLSSYVISVLFLLQKRWADSSEVFSFPQTAQLRFLTIMPVGTSHPSDTRNPAGRLRSVSNYH
eukprot:bmy_01043T0